MAGGPEKGPLISNSFKVGEDEIRLVSDPAHSLKNIRNCFQNQKILYMNDKYVQENGLSTNEVNFDVFEKIVRFDEERELCIAPHLSAKVLKMSAGKFKKMDVGIAMKLLSWDTARAIKWLVQNYPEEFPHYYMTTMVFIEYIAQWWDIMKSRSVKMCFHSKRPQIWRQNQEFLEKFIDFWGSMKVHPSQKQGYWKQQKSALISTLSILQLADTLVKKDGYEFFLPGRCLNDAIENFFSVVRLMNKNPTALMFERQAKAICITQFLKHNPRGCYEEDDSEILLVDFEDFKEHLIDPEFAEENQDIESLGDEVYEEIEKEDFDPNDKAETAALANIAGYMLKHTIKGTSRCKKCTDYFTADPETDEQERNSLIKIRSFTPGSLVLPSIFANEMFYSAELTFRSKRLGLLKQNKNIANQLLTFVLEDLKNEFSAMEPPTCHLKIIFGRFIRSRLHFWARKCNQILLPKQEAEIAKKAEASASGFQCQTTHN